MIQYQKTNFATNFKRLTFRNYGLTMMTSSTQNSLFENNLVNTSLHTKFGVPMTFGLGVVR